MKEWLAVLDSYGPWPEPDEVEALLLSCPNLNHPAALPLLDASAAVPCDVLIEAVAGMEPEPRLAILERAGKAKELARRKRFLM